MKALTKILLIPLTLVAASSDACIPQETLYLLKGDKTCYDIEFNDPHVQCMTVHAKRIKAAMIKKVKSDSAELAEDEKRLADEKIKMEILLVERQCGKEKAEFGPGTLGKRRYAFCINEGLKKVLLRLQHQ